jgi:hypothetical protein
MGRLPPRAIFIFIIALGIAVAAPLHALAMSQPCAQMSTDGPVTAAMGQSGDTLAGDDDPGSDLSANGMGALISMDCAQHCSDLGAAIFTMTSARHLAEAPPAGVTAAFTLVYPDIVPSPPRPGITS